MAKNELRKTPQNIEAEISVLGCGFLDRAALDKIMDEVSEEMFYEPKNRTIYKTMRTLHQNNIPIDVNTICNELEKDKLLSDVGGVEYITEIINSVPSTANLNYYIKIIFEKAVLRNLIAKADRIQEECYNEDDSIENIVESAERNILGVYNDKLGRDMQKIQDILPYIETRTYFTDEIEKVLFAQKDKWRNK